MAIRSKTPAAPVLSLSTVIRRPTIAIDGTHYEMRTADELPWLLYRGYAEKFQRAGELLEINPRTQAQTDELDAILPPLMEAVLVAPVEVLERLDNGQRFAVLLAFSALLPTTPATARAGAMAISRRMVAPAASRKRSASSTRTGAK